MFGLIITVVIESVIILCFAIPRIVERVEKYHDELFNEGYKAACADIAERRKKKEIFNIVENYGTK